MAEPYPIKAKADSESPSDALTPSITDSAAPAQEWDANGLWRDYVQLPRLADELLAQATCVEEPARPTPGWDAYRVWQERVLYGREGQSVADPGTYQRTSAEPQVNPPPKASSKTS
jgi:hypothetical protein